VLSDDVILAPRPAIGQLMNVYQQVHSSVIAVMEVPPDATRHYGVIEGEAVGEAVDSGRLFRIRNVVEKPAPGTAPSNLAIVGRYILTPKIFDKLEQVPHGTGGEIQLTDGLQALMDEQEVYGYAFEGVRYDAGTPLGWLQASVELALERPEMGPAFRRFLAGLDLRE
jgi:UTP--glucose-1-phosphate uridylyltransferase